MRILIIDDDMDSAETTSTWQILREKSGRNEIFISRQAQCSRGNFLSGYGPDFETGRLAELEQFLKTIDVLILDLGGLGPLQDIGRAFTSQDIERNLSQIGLSEKVSRDDFDLATGALSGIGFYHHHYAALGKLQAVFVVTQYDRARKTATQQERLVERLIDPFCKCDHWTPYTAKYQKGNDSKYLKNRLKCMEELVHDSGYVSLDNLSGIEFAAFHDRPVMLIGESGTGKEYAAKFIHRRWREEKTRLYPSFVPPDDFAVVNCATITETLAESLLFGHVQGAFTGATADSPGLILGQGCGLERLPRPRDGGDCFLPRLPEGVPPDTPRGTLFLDEFGDLAPAVQAKLLRYLQEWEVPVVGFRGVVKGARLRILAATSDPRFAAFAGYHHKRDRLRGQYRTPEELRRPLRLDLLFRIKGQTIRMDPVTTQNLPDVVDRLIRHSAEAKKWTPNARQCLVNKFMAHLREVDRAEGLGQDANSVEVPIPQGPDSESYRPVFGHKREIQETIRMIELFASTARQRGDRSAFAVNGAGELAITEKHVEAIFRPGGVYVATDSPTSSTEAPSFREQDPEETQIREEIRKVLQDVAPALVAGWTWDQLSQLVPTLWPEQRDRLKNAVLGPPGIRTTEDSKAARLRASGVGTASTESQDLATLRTKIRNRFDPKKVPIRTK